MRSGHVAARRRCERRGSAVGITVALGLGFAFGFRARVARISDRQEWSSLALVLGSSVMRVFVQRRHWETPTPHGGVGYGQIW